MEPIAIVGMACRLPGAQSLEDFWALLRDGRHGIDLIPDSRWDRERIFDPDPDKPGKINTRHGGFIEGIDLFDNHFFGISGEEARQMDPQQRIMLELAYEAFQDASLSLAALDEQDVGVFVGVMSNDYLRHQTAGEFRHIDRHTGAGSGYCMIANRISYQFNLRGPSMAIDSACSSSLVSTFMACESLWTNQCSVALAGGVNLILSPALSVFYTRGGLSAPDGKCRTLSADATGMGRGEGAGIVVLKRLSDAVRDNDNIYAVIRGGCVNHNGRGNGMSAPNRWAQQQLLRKACEHAGVASSEIQYVELHGTGTLVGDAIEATALGSVLGEDRDPDRPCLVGSVKTNLGHLEGAAGIAGLIKLALCLSQRQLVPSLWFNGPNPHIDLTSLPLKVQDHLRPWPDYGELCLAGISSFGLGGANSHLVLQSAPPASSRQASTAEIEYSVLQISARSEAALLQTAGRYADSIKDLTVEEFAALCRTTLVRPLGHEYRATLIARGRDEMLSHLPALGASTPSSGAFQGRHRESSKRKNIYVFPEFGAIDFSGAVALSEIHPCFTRALVQCDASIREVLQDPLEPLLVLLKSHSVSPNSLPFVHLGLQIALAALWQTAGLQPDAVAGAGSGQVAACLIPGALDMNGAVARIAACNGFNLTAIGDACLTQSGAFLVNCYLPQGKNMAPQLSDLRSDGSANLDLLTTLPALTHSKEVNYVLLGLDAIQSHLLFNNDPHGSRVVAFDPPMFWLELARLSVRQNILWQNFVASQTPVRLPNYPWQHARFWLDVGPTHQTDETPLALPRSDDAKQTIEAADELACAILPETAGNTDSLLDSEQPIGSSDHAASGFDRQGLLNLPESERRSALAAYLKRQVAETLRLPADELEEPQTLTGLGIDSLTAFQLKNRVEGDLKISVSLVKLLDGHSIEDLATDLVSDTFNPNSPAQDNLLADIAQTPSGHDLNFTPDGDIRAQIEAMSPELIDQMLSQLLTTSLHQR